MFVGEEVEKEAEEAEDILEVVEASVDLESKTGEEAIAMVLL